jgi:lambda repressor-like predicted transcriptional regulator
MSENNQRHGTTTGYRLGCRSDCCRKAMAASMALRRRRQYLARTNELAVPNIGTRRRIQALVALGWSLSEISREAGYDRSHAALILTRPGPLQQTTANRIAEVYGRLSMTLPPQRTKVEKIDASRSRNLARRKGWLPPLAWDEGAIDDPDHVPPVGRSEHIYLAAELVAEWDHLRRSGESIEQAAPQLGVTVGAIEKALERTAKESAA